MEISERIRMIIESHQITAGVFADKIGVQRSNVSHVLSGRNKPSFEFLEKVLIAFPRVSAQWLLTGNQTEAVVNESVQIEQKETKSRFTNVKNEDLKVMSTDSEKKVVKIVVFYDDFSFDVYAPNQQ
jgi:transcriptional regulator with XRE-family HTH domain